MKMEEAGKKNQIFCKLQGEDIIGFILRCVEKHTAVVVCINGQFGKEDPEEILSNGGKTGVGSIFGGFKTNKNENSPKY